MGIIGELIHNMLHSTVAGAIGVSAIFLYFLVIVVASIYRIKEGQNEHH